MGLEKVGEDDDVSECLICSPEWYNIILNMQDEESTSGDEEDEGSRKPAGKHNGKKRKASEPSASRERKKARGQFHHRMPIRDSHVHDPSSIVILIIF